MVQVRQINESFDPYPAALYTGPNCFAARWSGPVLGEPILIAGRFGGQAYRADFRGGLRGYFISFPTDTSQIAGFAFRRASTTPFADMICSFSSLNGNAQIGLGYTDDLRLRLFRGATTAAPVIATTGFPQLVNGTWHYIEFGHFLDDATGVTSVRIDGQALPDLDFVGDTKAHATDADVARFSILGGTTNSVCDWDDLYIENGGRVPVGEGRFELEPVNSDISTTGFTPSTGATLFGVMDEAPWNITDFASATNAADILRCGVVNLPTVPQTIFGVEQINLSQKDEAGTRTLRNKLWSGATLANGATQALQLNSFTPKRDWYPLNPNGSVPWTAGSFNAAEIGVEVVT